MSKIENELLVCAQKITRELKKYLSAQDPQCEKLYEAMRYSVLSAGKRVRPFLTLSFCDMFGGKEIAALPYACAVEMVHNYSLIHDDLPCMDNDDLRRGKPTNHKIYGEATSLLAADALLTHAFGVCAQNPYVSNQSIKNAVLYLSEAAGGGGMVGGQMIDTSSDREIETMETLEHMYRLKTGALIAASSILGVYAAMDFPTAPLLSDVKIYSYNIGLAFQFKDDILDLLGDAEEFGKTIGSDQKNGKITILSFMSVQSAEHYIADLTESAIEVLKKYEKNNKLVDLAHYLITRKR